MEALGRSASQQVCPLAYSNVSKESVKYHTDVDYMAHSAEWSNAKDYSHTKTQGRGEIRV